MTRGFLYSLMALVLYGLVVLGWIGLTRPADAELSALSGWILLLAFFFVGPAGFFLGYWRQSRLQPQQERWDPELKN